MVAFPLIDEMKSFFQIHAMKMKHGRIVFQRVAITEHWIKRWSVVSNLDSNILSGLRIWSRSTTGTLFQVPFHNNPWTLRSAQNFQTLLLKNRTGPKDFDESWKQKDPTWLKTQDLSREMEWCKKTPTKISNNADISSISTSLRFLRRWRAQSEESETQRQNLRWYFL